MTTWLLFSTGWFVSGISSDLSALTLAPEPFSKISRIASAALSSARFRSRRVVSSAYTTQLQSSQVGMLADQAS